MSLPFWGEEIIIDKKMVKLGEVIIKSIKQQIIKK
jgi:hypothetical protein